MDYVDVPLDITRIKVKFLFGLTKRQVICFGSGALVGVPLYLLVKTFLPSNIAALFMIGAMVPFFLFALYEKNGEPLEKVLRHFIQSRYLLPKTRPYQTENAYALIAKQIQVEKEVLRIVHGTQNQSAARKKAHARGKKAD